MALHIDKSIVVLTGSGISAESGLATFRDNNGLWENHRVEDVATPEAFQRDPVLVHNFYNLRRQQIQTPEVQPNAGHRALAELEKLWQGPFLLVTQNVDNLHERAGNKNIIHMHGELMKARNLKSGQVSHCKGDLSIETTPELRPHIVWFGEMPLELPIIYEALNNCDIFVAIGTSGTVYPAAAFANEAPKAWKLEVNLESTEISQNFDKNLFGPASTEVPRLLDLLI